MSAEKKDAPKKKVDTKKVEKKPEVKATPKKEAPKKPEVKAKKPEVKAAPKKEAKVEKKIEAKKPAAKAEKKPEAKGAKAPAKDSKKPEVKEEEAPKVDLERVYIIPLRDAKKASKRLRAKKGVGVVRKFLKRHMKADSVNISSGLNEYIWSRGITNVPPKVKVKASRAGGVVTAERLEK